MENLIRSLSAAGKDTEVLCGADGSRVLVLPHGGRVLGLFAPGCNENFLWTHPALSAPDSAQAFYASPEWHNSGGDRTWLAPEIDFFFPCYPSVDGSTYTQPRQLDPGRYVATRENGEMRLVNRLELTASRSGQTIELEIAKVVSLATNPLRHESSLRGLQYAGYTLHTSLELLSGTGRAGLWQLLQMPHGGTLLAPTYSRTEPRPYFGKIPADDLEVSDSLVRYHMRAAGEHKIGLRPETATGRVGYVYRAAEGVALVVRNFFVNPSGEYVDVPAWQPQGTGDAVQACNINSNLGAFSEMEYHVPAITRGGVEDRSEVWAFRCQREDIQEVAHILLGIEELP